MGYSKWKNLYKTLIDQNEELRQAQNNKECMVLNSKQNEYEQKISCLNQEIQRREKEMNEIKNKYNDIQNDYFSLESKFQIKERNDLMEKQAMKKKYEEQLENMRMDILRNKNKMEEEYSVILKKYENEKCKVSEKEQTLQLLQKQLSRFSINNHSESDNKQIESRMNAVFEQFNNSQNKLNEEIEELSKENVSYKFKVSQLEKELESNNEHTLRLKIEINQLSDSLNVTKEELMETESIKKEQNKLLQSTRNTLQQKNNSLHEMEQILKNHDEKISELKQIINDKDGDIDKLKQAQKEQNKLINDHKTIQNELENEICAKHSILTRLEAENETVRREFADLKLNYDSLQDDHQILNDVHSTLEYQKNENEEKMMALNKEMNDLNDKIKAELKCKEDIIESLQNEASQRTLNKDEMVKSLNMKNENLLKTINEINGEMDGIKESLKESENERLRKQIEIDSLRQKMEKIDGQLTDYKTVHNELENKYRANIVKYKKLENNYNEIQTKLNDKNMDLQRLLEQNKSIEHEFELFQNDSSLQMKSMNDTMHKLQNEMNENQKNYDLNKKEMISCHQTEIEKKEKCIVSMKEEMLNEINKFNIEKSRNSEKHQTEINELNDNLMGLKKEKTAIKDEYDIILKKYENEKCKLSEKEQTLQLLQKQLSRFDDDDIDNDSISNPIESRMSAIFEQLNNSQNKLNEEIEGYKLKIIEIEKARNATKESFESYKQTMSEQLDTAQQDIQIRQERSERLFKTFEQRLELRQKQNSEYKEKINELSNNIKSKKTEIEKHKMEIVEIKDQLKRCHQTINNAQTLNETLLHEKSQFDDKVS